MVIFLVYFSGFNISQELKSLRISIKAGLDEDNLLWVK
jgi:hypothetical protein